MFKHFDFHKKIVASMWIAFFLIAAVGLLFGYAAYKDSRRSAAQEIRIGEAKIAVVSVADTNPTRARGLSGRPRLLQDEGMLFVYDEPLLPRFWMKDMRFSIDIIWLDEHMRVVDVVHNLSPETYPQKYSPELPVKYVLEVNAGFAARNNITSGQQAEFSLKDR